MDSSTLLLLSLTALLSSSQLYDNATFYLGNNILANNDFTAPSIGSRYSRFYNYNIQGWNCTRYCQLKNATQVQNQDHYSIPANVKQMLDLDSDKIFEEVSQDVDINQTGSFLLSVYWLEPMDGYASGSSFGVMVNHTILGNITASLPFQRIQFVNQYLLDLTNGTNTISFQMYGSTPNGIGYYLTNVTLHSLVAFSQPDDEPLPQPTPEQTGDNTTEEQSSPQDSFTMNLESQLLSSDSYQSMTQMADAATSATTKVTSVITAIPLSVYFLGFVNYFALTSLYVLLNVKIPKGVYNHLSTSYKQLNNDILSMVGLEVHISPISSEKVNSERGQYFGVSTDVGVNNTFNFLFVGINIMAVLLIAWLSSFLSKNNPLRKLLNEQRQTMICGQLINLMIPLALPWSFVIMDGGFRDFPTKINSACYLVLFLAGVLFPVYYFFVLLQKSWQKLAQQQRDKQQSQRNRKHKDIDACEFRRKKVYADIVDISTLNKSLSKALSKYLSKSVNKPLRSVKQQSDKKSPITNKLVQFAQQNMMSNNKETGCQDRCQKRLQKRSINKFRATRIQFSLRKLVTYQIMEQVHMCQANFFLPFLVLLNSPLYFLMAIQLYNLLGLAIALKKKQGRINSIVLSLYPILFHAAFIIFYWVPSVEVLVYTEIAWFAVYLAGMMHHVLFLLYEAVAPVAQFVLWICKRHVSADDAEADEEERRTVFRKQAAADKSAEIVVEVSLNYRPQKGKVQSQQKSLRKIKTVKELKQSQSKMEVIFI